MKERVKCTSTRHRPPSGVLSRLEICGRAHDVRFTGSCQSTRVRDSVSKGKAGKYNTEGEKVSKDGVITINIVKVTVNSQIS